MSTNQIGYLSKFKQRVSQIQQTNLNLHLQLVIGNREKIASKRCNSVKQSSSQQLDNSNKIAQNIFKQQKELIGYFEINSFQTYYLSEAIKKHPQCVDEFKIRLVQKQIKQIDKIQNQYKKIDTLYLSNNCIKSIDGIEQFNLLQHLSISNNNISDIETLESLNMQGNPVSKHPVYRQLILTALPNLQQLDGKIITKEDKQQAEIQLKKQNSLLDLMLNNYIEIKKLYYIQKKLEIHQEIGQVHFQNIRYHPQFQNQIILLQQMKRMYDFQSHFPQFLKDVIQEQILNKYILKRIKYKQELVDQLMVDVLILYEQMNEQSEDIEGNYEQAFTQLLMKQQHLIAQLNISCEQKVHKINQLKKRISDNLKEQSHQYQHTQLNSTSKSNLRVQDEGNVYSPRITSEEIRQKSPVQEQDYNQNTLYYRSLNSSKRQNVINPQEESKKKSSSLKRDQSPNRNVPVPLSQEGQPTSSKKNLQSSLKFKKSPKEGGFNSTKKNTENVTFQQSQSVGSLRHNHNRSGQTVTSNHDCCRRFMNSDEEQLDEFKRSQDSRSPYRQTNNELKNMVHDLSQVVTMKEEEVKELQYLNQRIADEQTLKDKENQELYELAEKQQHSMKQRDKNSFEIEAEIKELRNQINMLMNKNIDLEKEAQEKADLEKQIILNEGQIQHLNYIITIEERAEDFNDRRLKRHLFLQLLTAVKTEQMIQQFRQKQIEINAYMTQQNFFKAWLRRVLIKKLERVQREQMVSGLQKKALVTWRKNIIFRQRLTLLQQKKQRSSLKNCMISWKKHQRIKLIKSQKREKLKKYFLKKLSIKAFKSLRTNLLANKMNPLKERKLMDQANTFYCKKLRNRIFEAWQTYQYEEAIPRKKRFQHIQKTQQHGIMQRIFRVLQQNRVDLKQKMMNARQYDAFQMKRLKNLIFKRWKQMYEKFKTQKQEFLSLCKHTTLKNTFKKWRTSYLESRHSKKMTLRYLSFVRKQLQLKYFKAIVQHRQQKIEERNKAIKIKKLALFNFYKLCFVSWVDRMKPLNGARQLYGRCQGQIQKNCFLQLKNFANKQKKYRFNKMNFEIYMNEKQKRNIKRNFSAFKKYSFERIRSRKLIQNCQINQKFKLYRIFINALNRENVIKKKSIIYSMNHQLKLNETNIVSSSDVIRSYEYEKQDLINEINQLKQENFDQKLALEEYQQAQIKYNSAMRSIERQEKIFKEERDAYEIRIRDYEELLKQIHFEYQNQIHQKDVQIHDISNESRAVAKQVSILQKEIEFKQSTILDTEKVLLNRGEQSTIILRETEKKLQNSILMANEFKNKIEDQFNEIEDLKNEMYSRDLDNEQLKMKLKESLDLIRETSTMYDGKINDFNAIIESKNSEIQEFIDKQIRFQTQINDLKVELKKQHLEIELFSEMQPMLEYPEVNRYYQEYQDLQNELDVQRNNLKQRMDRLDRSLNIIHDMDRRMKNQMDRNLQQEINSPLFSGHGSPLSDRIFKDQDNINFMKHSGVSTIKSYVPQQEAQMNYRSLDTFSNQHNQSNNAYIQMEEYQSAAQSRLQTDPISTKSRKYVERENNIRNSYEVRQEDNRQPDIISTAGQIADEIERNRSSRRLFIQTIEKRISRLENNIDRDLAQNEINRSRSQSPDYMIQS